MPDVDEEAEQVQQDFNELQVVDNEIMANEGIAIAVREAVEAVVNGQRNEVPAYDGVGNVKHWMLFYDMATQGKNENTKLSILIRSMRGIAYNWFCSTKMQDDAAGVHATSDEWKQRLSNFFGKTPSMALDELEGRRQRESEDALAYVRDILRLCAEVDPGMADATKIRHLMRGLLPRFRHDMMLMDPVDPSSFQKKLTKLMSNGKTEEDDTQKALFSALLTELQQKKQEAALLAAQPSSKSSASDDLLKQLIDRIDSLEKKMDTTRRNVTCFNCGKQGHLSRVCPEPRRQQPTAAKQSGNAGPRT